jgi:hypothetical protein
VANGGERVAVGGPHDSTAEQVKVERRKLPAKPYGGPRSDADAAEANDGELSNPASGCRSRSAYDRPMSTSVELAVGAGGAVPGALVGFGGSLIVSHQERNAAAKSERRRAFAAYFGELYPIVGEGTGPGSRPPEVGAANITRRE